MTPETPVSEAAQLMKSDDIGSLPILDGEQLAGMVTDRDIVIRAIAEGKDPRGMPVREVASRELVTVHADDDLSTALKLMASQQVRRLRCGRRQQAGRHRRAGGRRGRGEGEGGRRDGRGDLEVTDGATVVGRALGRMSRSRAPGSCMDDSMPRPRRMESNVTPVQRLQASRAFLVFLHHSPQGRDPADRPSGPEGKSRGSRECPSVEGSSSGGYECRSREQMCRGSGTRERSGPSHACHFLDLPGRSESMRDVTELVVLLVGYL